MRGFDALALWLPPFCSVRSIVSLSPPLPCCLCHASLAHSYQCSSAQASCRFHLRQRSGQNAKVQDPPSSSRAACLLSALFARLPVPHVDPPGRVGKNPFLQRRRWEAELSGAWARVGVRLGFDWGSTGVRLRQRIFILGAASRLSSGSSGSSGLSRRLWALACRPAVLPAGLPARSPLSREAPLP